MADTIGDLSNALLNQYSNSFKLDKSYTDMKNTIIDGMKQVLGTDKMTSSGYFYKGNTKDSQEQRSTYNNILKNFNDEENLIKKQFALKKSHEAELAALKAKYHVTSSIQEEQLSKKMLNDYKNLYKYQFDEKRKYYNQLTNEEMNIYKASLESGKKLTDDQLKQLKIINQKKTEFRTEEEREEEHKNNRLINQITYKLKNIDWKKIITDTINLGLDIYINNQIKNGLTNYANAYEEYFTPIAGRTGYANRQETHEFITDIVSEINSTDYLKKGLNFNKDVFPEILNATKQGFLGDEAQEVAISNAVDKKIMPWLNTSSDTWINMRYELSDEMLQSIKGQQLLLQETREGNRILQDGVVGILLDSMQPTLLNIDANTTDFNDLSSEAQGVYSYYRQFMSKQDAMKITNQMIDVYQDPSKALLNSGSTPVEKLMSMVSLNGGDIKDIARKYSQTANMALGTSAIGRGATANAMGINLGGWTRTESTVNKITDFKALENIMNIMSGNDEDAKQKYLDTVNELSNYVTATREYDNNIENIVTNIIKNTVNVPHLTDVLVQGLNQLKEIRKVLISMLVTSISSTFTNGSGGSGLLKLFTGGSGLKKAIEYGSEAYTGKMSTGTGLQYGGLVGGLTQGGANMTGLSGGAATLAGAGTVLAGGMLAKKGISTLGEAANYNKETDYTNKGNGMNIGTGLAMTGGGGMAIAAGLGLASGPIGWAGLIIGGGAYLAKAAYDNAHALSGSAEMVRQQSEETKDAINTENLERMTSARKLKENVDNSTSLTDKQNLIVQEGLASESEARKLNATEIDNLTQSYMSASKDIQSSSKSLVDLINREVVQKSQNNSKQMLDEIWNDINTKASTYGDVAVDDELYTTLELLMSGVTDEDTLKKWNDVIKDGKLTYYEALRMFDKFNPFSSANLYDVAISTDATKDVQTYTKYGSNIEFYDYNQEYTNIIADIGSKYKAYKFANDYNIKNNLKDDIISTYNKWRDDKDFEKFIKNVTPSSKDKLNTIADEFNLQKYRLGSTYIPYDSFALLHAGERVLTANQNKEYTKELQTGNGSIIVNSIQDVVSAIHNQTKTIIDYLSTMNFNNSSGFKKLNNLPTMGNTKITW